VSVPTRDFLFIGDNIMKNSEMPYFDPSSDKKDEDFDFNRWAKLIHSKRLSLEGLEKLDALSSREEFIAGIPTGLQRLDFMISGLQKGNLILVGARPSMGKTAFATSIVDNIAIEQKLSVAYFSLGVSKSQIMLRLVSGRSEIDNHKIKSAYLTKSDWPNLTETSLKFSRANIFIDDTSSISIKELSSKAKWLKKNYDIKFLVIDQLQMLYDFIKAGDCPVKMYNVSRSLKSLAVELDIPILVLSHVSREVDEETNHWVKIIDLPGAGSIAHPADVVLFLRREEYYDPQEDNRGKTNVIVAKNSYGSLGMILILFKNYCMRFEDFEAREI